MNKTIKFISIFTVMIIPIVANFNEWNQKVTPKSPNFKQKCCFVCGNTIPFYRRNRLFSEQGNNIGEKTKLCKEIEQFLGLSIS